MQEDDFYNQVKKFGGPSGREDAMKLTTVVLQDLGRRLKGEEPNKLAAQLPESLKAPLTVHANEEPVTDDLDDFLRRVADHLGAGVDPEQARDQVQAVFATLSEAVSDGEIDDVRAQLPAGFGALLTK